MRQVFMLFAVFATAAIPTARADEAPQPDLRELAKQAASADEAVAGQAIQRLRAAEEEGLKALFEVHEELINRANGIRVSKRSEFETITWRRVARALDTVGGQRDCYASRLFWHTDFNAALSASMRQKKPIISLRLLGNLTDELSCANSRFFRSTLYANQEVGKLLRERFILHWQSVRPVPKVTIDFGDGRKIETTVTGNSVHYVLDYEGRVIDALPGLYGPKAFSRELERTEQLSKDLRNLWYTNWSQVLRNHHQQRASEIQAAWREDLWQLGIESPDPKLSRAEQLASIGACRWAKEEAATTEEVWTRIGALHSDDADLDQASAALIFAQQFKVQNAIRAGRGAFSKAAGENPVLRLLADFKRTLAVDTVRNEYLLHGQIHCWLAEANQVTLQALNERVYSELFLTPNSDPWLGLLPADTYSGLENGGIVQGTGK